MASFLYDSYKESLLDSSAPDLSSVRIDVTMVSDDDYTASESTHDFFDDVTDYLNVTPDEIDSKTITDGAFDSSATPTFSAVSIDGAKKVHALVIYYNTLTASTSPLIAYIDLGAGDTGAVTPNGGDITITWDSSPSYIFSF